MSVETCQYLTGVRRMIRAAGRRVANADEPELEQLVELRVAVDEAIAEAVDGWRALGRSWSVIGEALGMTKQGAMQRYGRRGAA